MKAYACLCWVCFGFSYFLAQLTLLSGEAPGVEDTAISRELDYLASLASSASSILGGSGGNGVDSGYLSNISGGGGSAIGDEGPSDEAL